MPAACGLPRHVVPLGVSGRGLDPVLPGHAEARAGAALPAGQTLQRSGDGDGATQADRLPLQRPVGGQVSHHLLPPLSGRTNTRPAADVLRSARHRCERHAEVDDHVPVPLHLRQLGALHRLQQYGGQGGPQRAGETGTNVFSTPELVTSCCPALTSIWQVCQQTAQFEDFILEFLNRCFAIIENSEVQQIRSETSRDQTHRWQKKSSLS